MKNISNPLNLIYVCTAEKGPSGGAKIIYNHSEHINKLNITNVSSEILHIKKKKIRKWNTSLKKVFKYNDINYSGWDVNDITVTKGFKSKWFKNKIKIKEDFIFDKEKDKVVIVILERKLGNNSSLNFYRTNHGLDPMTHYKKFDESNI